MTNSDTVPLHAEITGEGHALIVLHGLFGSLGNWRPVSRELGDNFSVFALDLRNHGRSPHHDEWNHDVMAQDVGAFMEQQQLASAFLLGHSLGGKTAMQFALSYPGRVDKLIVADMSPRASRPRHREILAALNALDLDAARNRRELDAQLAPAIPDAAMRGFLLMNVATDEAGRLQWRMNLEAITRSYDEVNRAVESDRVFDKPTLFIRGGNSDYIGPEDEAVIAALFPQARVITIAGAGHWVHADAPAEFARLVREFLQA